MLGRLYSCLCCGHLGSYAGYILLIDWLHLYCQLLQHVPIYIYIYYAYIHTYTHTHKHIYVIEL